MEPQHFASISRDNLAPLLTAELPCYGRQLIGDNLGHSSTSSITPKH